MNRQNLRKRLEYLKRKEEEKRRKKVRATDSGSDSEDDQEKSELDNEYRMVGVQDPYIFITSSRNPSSRLKIFTKELRLMFPNAKRMNRGHYDMKTIIEACLVNNVTDLVIAHETRGQPDSLIISHLPLGPTAYFSLKNLVTRHDTEETTPMSEQFPHLVFHNFKSKLGVRVMQILQALFPVPPPDSKRTISFANNDDWIYFRHHNIVKKDGKHQGIKEIGPRFELFLYKLVLGTIDKEETSQVEWAHKPFMNTTFKRRFLSDDDGWEDDD